MKKRICAFALVLVMALSLLPVGALAAEEQIFWLEPIYMNLNYNEESCLFDAVDNSYTHWVVNAYGQLVTDTAYESINFRKYLDGTLWRRYCLAETGDPQHSGLTHTYDFYDTTNGTLIASVTNDDYKIYGLAAPGLIEVWSREERAFIGPQCGIMDSKGNIVIPVQYDIDITYGDGLFRTCTYSEEDGYTYYYLDTSGNPVLTFTEYSNCQPFHLGLAQVQKDGKIGYINKSGDMVIPAKYNGTGIITDEVIPMFDNGEMVYYDYTGAVVDPPAKTEEKKTPEFVLDGDTIKDKNGNVIVASRGAYNIYALLPSEGLAIVARMTADYLTRQFGILHLPTAAAPAITSTGIDPQPSGTAQQSTQPVNIGGQTVELQAYALKDGSASTNYVKIRDVAAALDGTASQFDVTWDGTINLVTGTAYASRNGQENQTPYSGDRVYTKSTADTRVNGVEVPLQAFVLTDDAGNGSTYYKLRDLGQALGFNVGWDGARGIFLEPGVPYDPAN